MVDAFITRNRFSFYIRYVHQSQWSEYVDIAVGVGDVEFFGNRVEPDGADASFTQTRYPADPADLE